MLTEKAWVVNGELVEADVDKFIHDQLAANAVITPVQAVIERSHSLDSKLDQNSR